MGLGISGHGLLVSGKSGAPPLAYCLCPIRSYSCEHEWGMAVLKPTGTCEGLPW